MSKEDNIHFVDQVVAGLRTAADELEKLQLQVALGKMEAFDAFEEMKKTYRSINHEVQLKFISGKEKYEDIKQYIDELQVQFELGKADTAEAFHDQKKLILEKLHSLETKIRTNPTLNNAYAYLIELIEKIKAKLEIIGKQLEPIASKVGDAVKSGYESGKEYTSKVINDLKSRWEDVDDLSSKASVFKEEMGMAFDHLKKAFVQS